MQGAIDPACQYLVLPEICLPLITVTVANGSCGVDNLLSFTVSLTIGLMLVSPEYLLQALQGQLSEHAVADLAEDLRKLPPASVLRVATQANINIRGDGVIVGNNNVSIVIKGEGAGELTRILHDALKRGRALSQLRPPVKDFIGRGPETTTLVNALDAGKEVNVACITGMSGIGKTELALTVAANLSPIYPDAQLLIKMRGRSNTPRASADALATCIRAFTGSEIRLPEDEDELAGLYRSCLSGKRVLILLDDVLHSAQVQPFMPPEGCALLITSQNAISLPSITRVRLDQLNPDEASRLLIRIASRTAPDAAHEICSLCGYLPLAIRAAGSLLDVTIDLDPSTYATQLRNERMRLQLLGGEDFDTSVEASFNLSYIRLAPEAARVFRQLSVYPSSFEAASEEVLCEDANHLHLSNLLRRSLVQYDDRSSRYYLHDLMRLFAAKCLDQNERNSVSKRHAKYFRDVLRSADQLYFQGGEALKHGLDRFDSEWENIKAGYGWAEQHVSRDEEAAMICSDYLNAGAHVLDLRQRPSDRIHWLEAALAAAQQLTDRTAIAKHLGNLGNAYATLGEISSAIRLYRQALDLQDEINNAHGKGKTLNNMGNVYSKSGEFNRAIDLYMQALNIADDLGDDHLSGDILTNLGSVYAAQGKLIDAISFYEKHLSIARKIGDRRGEGSALTNLGNAYGDLGEHSCAIAFHEQALNIFNEIGDQQSRGTVLNNLGAAYADLNDFSCAIGYYEQYLTYVREINEHRNEGITLWNMSLTLDKAGSRVQAVSYAEASLVIFDLIKDSYGLEVRQLLTKWNEQKV